MKLAIVGSRDFQDYKLLYNKVFELFGIGSIEKIISGGARGADTLAEQFARECSIPLQVFEADWKTYGRSAGFIRNQKIVAVCDTILAFWDQKSRGTADTIKKAREAGKKVFVVKI